MMLIYHLFNFSGGDVFQKILHEQDLKCREYNSAPLGSMQNIQKRTYQAPFLRGFQSLFHDLMGMEEIIFNYAQS